MSHTPFALKLSPQPESEQQQPRPIRARAIRRRKGPLKVTDTCVRKAAANAYAANLFDWIIDRQIQSAQSRGLSNGTIQRALRAAAERLKR